jgi:M-phase phosphoprotein 8
MGKEYVVEAVLDSRKNSGRQEYKIKWKGYSINECTWEPEEHLGNCTELIDRFRRTQREKKSVEGKTARKMMACRTVHPSEPEDLPRAKTTKKAGKPMVMREKCESSEE